MPMRLTGTRGRRTMNMDDEHIKTDVLVLGGGLAGCFAAVKASAAGAKVVVFEKAEMSRSGNGGTGLHRIPLIHPDHNYAFEEFAKLNVATAAEICDEDVSLEFAKDTLDRVLDLEPGVHLEEIEIFLLVDQELDRSCVDIIHRPGRFDRYRAHGVAQVLIIAHEW